MAAGLEKMMSSRIRWLWHDSIDPDGEFGGMMTHASDLLIWFRRDGGGIYALGLGLDGSDLGFSLIMETQLHHLFAVMPTRGAAARTRLQRTATAMPMRGRRQCVGSTTGSRSVPRVDRFPSPQGEPGSRSLAPAPD
jgi:hypothetical protein